MFFSILNCELNHGYSGKAFVEKCEDFDSSDDLSVLYLKANVTLASLIHSFLWLHSLLVQNAIDTFIIRRVAKFQAIFLLKLVVAMTMQFTKHHAVFKVKVNA